MAQVITQADVDAVAAGGTLSVDPDAQVTPLAAERAAARNVRIDRSGASDRDTIRAVTRAVVGRLGDAGPQVIEAVITEVLAAMGGNAAMQQKTITTPRGATLLPIAGQAPPSVDYCATCIEQEKSRGRRRAVLTTTGRNAKGVVARITARIADLGGDILDISQTLVGDYFTMIIVVDTASLSVAFERFQEELVSACKEIGCQAMLMHEDVMTSLHRV
jgi:ACT domain-containing protein